MILLALTKTGASFRAPVWLFLQDSLASCLFVVLPVIGRLVCSTTSSPLLSAGCCRNGFIYHLHVNPQILPHKFHVASMSHPQILSPFFQSLPKKSLKKIFQLKFQLYLSTTSRIEKRLETPTFQVTNGMVDREKEDPNTIHTKGETI